MKIYVCIHRLTQTRTVTCHMTDPSSRQGGRPTTKQNRNCLNYSQNLVMGPAGARRQDGLTD